MYSALPKVCERGQGSCMLAAAAHASSRGQLSFVRGRTPAPSFNFFSFIFFNICLIRHLNDDNNDYACFISQHKRWTALTCLKTSNAEEDN
ncbi:hypothetical protein O181_084428 [Austropuccinia psidii MF-1]|uniref:Uncharacterized protein n=1 Tax=Austropuccinia psidii MF-1 TaxID=1389203 RepID=A0A9Q3FRB1_9BASI|nr:hypothetical protein [Austropuccinia psidii MF-1]